MKATRLRVLGVGFLLAGGLAGCGPAVAERAAQARPRLELEHQAQREVQQANQAITTLNQKLGRKPPALDLGLTTPAKPEPALQPTQQP